VEARAGPEEWAIRIRAAAGHRRTRAPAQLAKSLHDERRVLGAVSRDIQRQGGLLWVDLLGPEALAVCLTLPLPKGGGGGCVRLVRGAAGTSPPAGGAAQEPEGVSRQEGHCEPKHRTGRQEEEDTRGFWQSSGPHQIE
jgi:hypothetical protein